MLSASNRQNGIMKCGVPYKTSQESISLNFQIFRNYQIETMGEQLLSKRPK